jgi:hypothetical protein
MKMADTNRRYIMKFTVNNIDYFFELESDYPIITKCSKTGSSSQKPVVYNFQIQFATENELTTYPLEILGRVVTKIIQEGMKNTNK